MKPIPIVGKGSTKPGGKERVPLRVGSSENMSENLSISLNAQAPESDCVCLDSSFVLYWLCDHEKVT